MPPTTAARWIKMSGLASLYSRNASDFSRRSYSRLCGVPISRQPARRNFSTTNEPINPLPPLNTTRRFSQKPIPRSSVLRSLAFNRPHRARHRILPMVPMAEFPFQNRFSAPERSQTRRFEICVDHDRHQFAESNPRFPAKFLPCFSRIRNQAVHFQGAQIAFRHLYMLLPVQSGIGKRFLHKFAHRMSFARPDHDIL